MVKPKSDTERLYEDTRSIYEKFTPLKVKPLRNLTCDRAAAAQFLFSTAVRTGWETHGVELDEPAYTYLDFASFRKKSSTLPRKVPESKQGSKENSGKDLPEDGRSQAPPAVLARRSSDGQKMLAPKLPPRKPSSLSQDATPPIRDVPATPPFRDVPATPPFRDIPPPLSPLRDKETSEKERQEME